MSLQADSIWRTSSLFYCNLNRCVVTYSLVIALLGKEGREYLALVFWCYQYPSLRSSLHRRRPPDCMHCGWKNIRVARAFIVHQRRAGFVSLGWYEHGAHHRKHLSSNKIVTNAVGILILVARSSSARMSVPWLVVAERHHDCAPIQWAKQICCGERSEGRSVCLSSENDYCLPASAFSQVKKWLFGPVMMASKPKKILPSRCVVKAVCPLHGACIKISTLSYLCSLPGIRKDCTWRLPLLLPLPSRLLLLMHDGWTKTSARGLMDEKTRTIVLRSLNRCLFYSTERINTDESGNSREPQSNFQLRWLPVKSKASSADTTSRAKMAQPMIERGAMKESRLRKVITSLALH